MISPHCYRSRNTCSKAASLLALCFCLSSCASLSEVFYSPSESKEAESVTREKKRTRVISSQFEWAVQNYEAGDYDKAIQQFRQLESVGPNLSSFELIPFYLGMSQFQKKNYPEAVVALERFLALGTSHRETQEARLALLASFERLSAWEKVLGLAAEMDKQTLFQNNRAFLKLVWARALLEKGETQGARAVLKDAALYLDGQAPQRPGSPDRDRDLWGRYHFTRLLVELSQCQAPVPREVGGKKKRRLYEAWLDAAVDCYRGRFAELVEGLVKTESPWVEAGTQAYNRQIQKLGQRISGYRKDEAKQLSQRRALEDLARRQMYRLLGTIDEQLKNLQKQQFSTESLSAIRKEVDLLLVSLSAPS